MALAEYIHALSQEKSAVFRSFRSVTKMMSARGFLTIGVERAILRRQVRSGR
jgi:hypothetical protein